MKNTTLVTIFLMSIISTTAYADQALFFQGVASVAVDGQTYELALAKCSGRETLSNGKPYKVFTVSTHASRKDKTSGPRFTALGVYTEQEDQTSSKKSYAKFHLSLNGGLRGGGVEYSGQMPLDSFRDKQLDFQGQAKRRQMNQDGKLAASFESDISISVLCN